jgi:serine protease Do
MTDRTRINACLLCGASFVAAMLATSRRGTAEDREVNEQPKLPSIAHGNLLAPKAFRAAVDKVLPSVVTIESFGGVSSVQGRIGGIRRQGEGPSTGLIVSPDGYLVTSTFNFIKRPPIITVIFHDGTRRVAKLLGRDDTRKLCILKVDDVSDLPVPPFVPRSEMRVGQWAISVGIGYGDTEPAVSAGIISATSRMSGRAVQTDANTSPANYGGPLLDIDGRVLGICVPLSPRSQAAGAGVEWYDSGIGFAVPLHNEKTLIAALKEGKTIKAGFLGVQVKPANANGTGVEVTVVQKKSAAEEAGLKKGDVIVSINDDPVIDPAQLRISVSSHVAGETIKVKVKRGEESIELQANLKEATQQAKPSGPRIPVPKPK